MYHGPIDAEPKRVYKFRHVCMVHTELYHKLVESCGKDSEEVALLKEAYWLGVKLVQKLRQHKFHFDAGWYERNKTIEPPSDTAAVD